MRQLLHLLSPLLIIFVSRIETATIYKDVINDNLQKLTFYSNNNYTGAEESFSEHVPNIQETTQLAKDAKSFCVFNGVWMIYGKISLDGHGLMLTSQGVKDHSLLEENVNIEEGLLVNSNLGRMCVTFDMPEKNQSAVYTSIRHLASNDLLQPSLSLYSRHFRGNELFVSGSSFRLPSPISINSFAFTNNTQWTIFTGVDETGESYCLPIGNDPFLAGISFSELNESIHIGSAVKGCDDKTKKLGVKTVDIIL